MAKFPPQPSDDSISQEGRVSLSWEEWFDTLATWVADCARRVGSVSLTAQSAAIGATAVTSDTLTGGLYRLSYYARISTAAATTSSLTVTLGWTDDAVTLSEAGAAMTGNTTATTQSGERLIEIDGGSSVTYTTTYASNPASAMEYKLSVTLEAVNV